MLAMIKAVLIFLTDCMIDLLWAATLYFTLTHYGAPSWAAGLIAGMCLVMFGGAAVDLIQEPLAKYVHRIGRADEDDDQLCDCQGEKG
jgi:hypothetical protein